jgi:membrane associated rhomboid family serine protease
MPEHSHNSKESGTKEPIPMIPLKDKNPTKHFPVINILLIVINISAFVYQLTLGPRLEGFLFHYGLTPGAVSQTIRLGAFNPFIFLTFISCLFLHGGWLHLGGNMLYLWIFGDNVEDKLGHFRYLIFYLLCGIAASALHVYIQPNSMVPTIGASGAISGVLGAYIIMFPRARVLTLIPIFIFIQLAELPAYILLGFWFVLQFFNGVLSLGYEAAGMGGVAWWAHVGGFVGGLLFVFPFRKYQ